MMAMISFIGLWSPVRPQHDSTTWTRCSHFRELGLESSRKSSHRQEDSRGAGDCFDVARCVGSRSTVASSERSDGVRCGALDAIGDDLVKAYARSTTWGCEFRRTGSMGDPSSVGDVHRDARRTLKRQSVATSLFIVLMFDVHHRNLSVSTGCEGDENFVRRLIALARHV